MLSSVTNKYFAKCIKLLQAIDNDLRLLTLLSNISDDIIAEDARVSNSKETLCIVEGNTNNNTKKKKLDFDNVD